MQNFTLKKINIFLHSSAKTLIIYSIFIGYLITRYDLRYVFIYILVALFLVYLVNRVIKLGKIRYLIILITITYLVFSFFNFRSTSWDGNNLYLKNVLILVEDFNINYIDKPILPYLSEYFLAAIYKFGSLRVMNLAFGVATIGSMFTTFILYKRIGLSKQTIDLGLTILLLNPVFLIFAVSEFKIDMFLLLYSNLTLLSFLWYLKYPTVKKSLILGFLVIVTSLSKLIFIPSAVVIITACIFYLHQKKILKYHAFIPMLTLSMGVIIWTFFFGLRISHNEPFVVHKYGYLQGVDLDRNQDIVSQCYSDIKKIDYGQYYYDSTITERFLQPLYFLLNKVPYPAESLAMSRPGPFVYFGAVLFLLLPMFGIWKKISTEFKLIYFIALPSIAIYLLFVRTVFWYLYFLFPFFSVLIPLLLQTELRKQSLKTIFYVFFVTISLIEMPLTTYFTYGTDFTNKLPPSNQYAKVIYNGSKVIQSNLSSEEFIMDSSEHKTNVFFPYLESYDKKVIESEYYFVASQKSTDEMYYELKNKRVKIIAVNQSYLLNNFFWGCPHENNLKLNDFLNKHTEPIFYYGKNPVIFKII